MKIREKNHVTKEMIESFVKMSYKDKEPFWNALAKSLNRSNKSKYEVNLFRLEKFAKEKETIVVPGAVLGSGNISKPIDIAALKFSESAREKITKAGGACFSITELPDKKIKTNQMRIMG